MKKLVLAGLTACALPVAAQVLDGAQDAFGRTVGKESIGLYSASQVRGFSPRRAGNIRLEGLYLDERAWLNEHLLDGSRVHVGLSAAGYAFPAPTGVVDHTLRRPGQAPSVAWMAEVNQRGGTYLDLDARTPLADGRLGLSLGASVLETPTARGGIERARTLALVGRWQPLPQIELLPFAEWMHERYPSQPLWITHSAQRPPVQPTRALGPAWARNGGLYRNLGLVGQSRWGDAWALDALVVRSIAHDARGIDDVYEQQPDGRWHNRVYTNPDQRSSADSGELRLSHRRVDGPREQQWIVTLRARDRQSRYGGEGEHDLGLRDLAAPSALVQPPAPWHGAPTHDRVRQTGLGLTWRSAWADRGELSLGLMRTPYRKRTLAPDEPAVETRTAPLLGAASMTWHASPTVSLYAGFTQGLEESGTAPSSASNRHAALPAIRTAQRDAGLRWQAAPELTLIAGLFDVRKPYFSFGAGQRYDIVGQVRHRGLEASVSGRLAPGWQLMLGAVGLDARLTSSTSGASVRGQRPVGSARWTALAHVEHTLATWPALSLEAGVAHSSARIASDDNRLRLPAATRLNVVARVTLPQGTLRASVENATNRPQWDVVGANTFMATDARQAHLSWSSRW